MLSRFAFRVPLPPGRLALTVIAGLAMALVVAASDRALHVGDLAACIVLTGAGL